MTLRFDFLGKTRYFSEPIEIISADHLEQVVPALQQVEQAVAQGYYAAGYVAYEAASAFQAHHVTGPKNAMPLLWFGIYRSPSDITPPTLENRQATHVACDWQTSVTPDAYRAAIDEIKRQIEQGNTYQVNYTLRLTSDFSAPAYPFYLHLLAMQRAKYSAYLDMGDFHILSASPELFFHWQDQKITTKPMKGTAPRGTTWADDQSKRELLKNEKNQAENMMIVDLLRNDLSQIALPGSVKVPQLFEIEKYPTVWQLTSTIEAALPQDVTLSTIFKALFPCGSITGAPKASTMQVISGLESSPRGVYCGAIGMITPEREAIFSIPIRTVVVDTKNQTAVYGSGGGVTWDSAAQDEFDEIKHKAQILGRTVMPEQLLESLLLEQGKYDLLTHHVARLQQSADYFDFSFEKAAFVDVLQQIAEKHLSGRWKVRVLLDQKGQWRASAEAIEILETPLRAKWAQIPMQTSYRLLYHKTTRREFYPPATLDDEFLLFNERDEITEFVNGNVVVRFGDKWLTPPVECGLLPGTRRAALLVAGKIQTRIITRDELNQADEIAFINSVRGWRQVDWQG